MKGDTVKYENQNFFVKTLMQIWALEINKVWFSSEIFRVTRSRSLRKMGRRVEDLTQSWSVPPACARS